MNTRLFSFNKIKNTVMNEIDEPSVIQLLYILFQLIAARKMKVLFK